jgi:hypothetical protein
MFRYWGHVLYFLNINFADSLRSSSHQIWENIIYHIHYMFLHTVYGKVKLFHGDNYYVLPYFILINLLLLSSSSSSSLRNQCPAFRESVAMLYSLFECPVSTTMSRNVEHQSPTDAAQYLRTMQTSTAPATSVLLTVRLQSVRIHKMFPSFSK